MPGLDFAQLKQQASCLDVMHRYGWSPTRREPSAHRGRCPFCGGSARSRRFAVTRSGYYCHSCHARGDVISLYQQLYSVPTPYEAAVLLEAEFSLSIRRISPPWGFKRGRKADHGTEKRNGTEDDDDR
jgi:hypothetical protein